MEREVADGYVHRVSYRVDGTDGEFFASFTSQTFLVRPSTDLIPFEQLTESLVLEWISEVLGVEGVAAIESGILAELQDQRNPRVAEGLPWVI